MNFRTLSFLFTFSSCLVNLCHPQISYGAEDKPGLTKEQFIASLHFQQGRVDLGTDLASASLGNDFKYLGPQDADRLLQAWGNPPDADTLGLIMPATQGPLDESGWAIIVSYQDDGHISDADAESIDYKKLLGEMQERTKANNAARVKEGYDPIQLVGWAATPHYDRSSRKLYWAKELKFAEQSPNTLNFDIRALGRGGVLVLQAVSTIDQTDLVSEKMQIVLERVEFKAGQRYEDYKEGIDKKATYGIAALVAGTVLAKSGFLKVLLAGLLAAKKFILIGLVGLSAAIKRLFGRTKKSTEEN